MAATTLEGVETAMHTPLPIGLPVSLPKTAKQDNVLCVSAAAVALHQQT
jgi:hypothetical protein